MDLERISMMVLLSSILMHLHWCPQDNTFSQRFEHGTLSHGAAHLEYSELLRQMVHEDQITYGMVQAL